MNKNILIITRDFPPNHFQVGWMIRMAYLASYLDEQNYNVHVIAVDSGKKNESSDELLDISENINTHFIKNTKSVFNSILKKIKIVSADSDEKILKNIQKKSFDLIEKFNIDNVIISSPPGSFRKLSVPLRKKFGEKINIIADYRDSWSLRWMYVKDRNETEYKKLQKLEQKTIDANTVNIFVSDGMKIQYEANFKFDKSAVIENGYIEYKSNEELHDKEFLNFIENSRINKKMIFVYCGSGSATGKGHKDLKLLLDLAASDSEINKKTSFVFIGKIKEIEKYENKVDCFIAGVKSNKTIPQYLKYCDVGITVHTHELEAPAVMGGKIYDYIASSLPVWFIVPENAYSIKKFIEKHGKGYLSDCFNNKTIKKELETILNDFTTSKIKKSVFSANELKEYTRNEQYKKFIKLFI